jgi:hypothetical protein
MNLHLLKAPHYVDDPLEDVLDLTVRQRAAIGFLYVLQNPLLAFRFVNRKTGVVLEPSNLLCRCRTLVDELDHLEIELIDFHSPISYVHAFPLSCEQTSRKPEMNSATAFGAFRPCFSISDTIALPMTPASANAPTA